jgi:hypothetical protein
MLPDVVTPFIVALTQAIAVNGFPHVRKLDGEGHEVPRLWDLFRTVLADNRSLLDCTVVIFIFREGGQTLERAVGKHLENRPFGFEFTDCPKECRGQFRLATSSRDSKVRMACTKCKWQSKWVAVDSNKHFHLLHPSAPKIFWHTFPATHSAANLFIDAE